MNKRIIVLISLIVFLVVIYFFYQRHSFVNTIIALGRQTTFLNNNLKIFNAASDDKESLQIMYGIAKTNNKIKMSAGEERNIVVSNPKEQYIIKLKLNLTNDKPGDLVFRIYSDFSGKYNGGSYMSFNSVGGLGVESDYGGLLLTDYSTGDFNYTMLAVIQRDKSNPKVYIMIFPNKVSKEEAEKIEKNPSAYIAAENLLFSAVVEINK